ncbi:transcription elongation factor GreB [Methylovorus glucosotrophus]|jgi:transcription elongation factor GreB|uniref:Transcription elongation factor GreB n=2 Tax=Methylovorus glucosotrophus TaxID=266009 RepID=C6XD59_METGS|nr:transcription elongation factor GreB [Methylovorus glucosotrophus]ACT50484.1 transcription elongation factor GreB [Methylovorus glucosotrophus SIP3-4]KAF0844110.1 transcription elongation factor GreB [Methylovorus glucosotrophus]
MARTDMADQKNYITPEGYATLKAEFEQLYKIERPKVVSDVSWAASNGDRSENGDYIYGKRRLRQIDSRLRFLMKSMDLAVIVDPKEQQSLEKVFFGAWVSLYSLERDIEHHYRIVGQNELDPTRGYISWISPLARAMLGKQIGDVVRAQTPAGEESYEIIDIRYSPPES